MLKTKPAPYTFVKQGIFFFSRRVPSDHSHHYTADRIIYSLRTRSASVASSRAQRAAHQLDEHWYHLRFRDIDLPGKHLLRMGSAVRSSDVAPIDVAAPDAVTLSEAVAIYLRLKGKGRPVTFRRAAERSCGYVIDACGDKNLTDYRSFTSDIRAVQFTPSSGSDSPVLPVARRAVSVRLGGRGP